MSPISQSRRLLQRLGLIVFGTGIQILGVAHASTDGVPAMYATQAEAAAAAKKHFNCTGAHQMGKQWMPCSSHGHANGHDQHKH